MNAVAMVSIIFFAFLNIACCKISPWRLPFPSSVKRVPWVPIALIPALYLATSVAVANPVLALTFEDRLTLLEKTIEVNRKESKEDMEVNRKQSKEDIERMYLVNTFFMSLSLVTSVGTPLFTLQKMVEKEARDDEKQKEKEAREDGERNIKNDFDKFFKYFNIPSDL